VTADRTGESRRDRLIEVVPILGWLPHYDRRWLSRDILAGLTLWGLLVPEAMAYAGIAGLPPQAGLYTLVASLLVYALLGTSRHLSVGPTSATAALLASSVLVAIGVATLEEADPATYQAYASAFVLVTGLVFLAAGLTRLGFITQFLSRPVMDGFILGLALFVAVGQLNKLLGVDKPDGNTVQRLVGLIGDIPNANPTTVLVGVVALLLLFGLPRWSRKVPAGLVVLFLAIGASAALDLSATSGVEVVGELPSGLPSLTFEPIPLDAYLGMILPAIGVLLVAYSEAVAVAREFASKHGYEIDADQELNAHAAGNIVSAFFGGMLAAGSMSASAVKEGAGARSQVTNLITWVATLVTLLFLTPLFAPLPEAVLGALIIHALWHILVSRKLRRLREASPTEFWFGLFAMLGVVLIDVLQGMVIGLVSSLLFVVYRSSRPHLARLGRVAGTAGAYSDLERHPDNRPVPGLLIVRLDAPVYYANALTVRDQIKTLLVQADPPPTALVLDMRVQSELDLTTVDMLSTLLHELRARGIDVGLADVRSAVVDTLRSHAVLDELADTRIFWDVEQAVAGLEPGGPPKA